MFEMDCSCEWYCNSVFFSRSFSCQIGFFFDENGVHFAIIKFLWISFLVIYDSFLWKQSYGISNDSIFGYGLRCVVTYLTMVFSRR